VALQIVVPVKALGTLVAFKRSVLLWRAGATVSAVHAVMWHVVAVLGHGRHSSGAADHGKGCARLVHVAHHGARNLGVRRIRHHGRHLRPWIPDLGGLHAAGEEAPREAAGRGRRRGRCWRRLRGRALERREGALLRCGRGRIVAWRRWLSVVAAFLTTLWWPARRVVAGRRWLRPGGSMHRLLVRVLVLVMVLLLLLLLLLLLMLMMPVPVPVAMAMAMSRRASTAATTASAPASDRPRKRRVVLIAAGRVRQVIPIGRRGRSAASSSSSKLRHRGRDLAVQRGPLVVRLGERSRARRRRRAGVVAVVVVRVPRGRRRRPCPCDVGVVDRLVAAGL